jgi:excisionase family DNA binding protein
MELTMSITQAQLKTGIGRTKLYEAINSGNLEACKVGRRTVIRQTDLEKFVSSLPKYPVKSTDTNQD